MRCHPVRLLRCCRSGIRLLRFDTPSREEARRELVTGGSVYVKRDASLPLVDFGVVLRGGSYLDPAQQTGLASLTASMMRVGGTANLEPQAFEDRADFLADTR